jgi:hypothetical protein
MFNPELRVPFGYSTATRTLAEVRTWLLVHHHPEYVHRFLHWLDDGGGQIGAGGGWRSVQPDKDGFAPEGKSFHQDQRFRDGFVGAAAVDVVVRNPGHVHRAPRWDEVPIQGSKAAALYGVHANVDQGARPEPWHIQPVELDGWQTWINAGSPAPRPNYPLPGESTPAAPIPPAPLNRGRIRHMLIIKYGGTPDSGWAGLYSCDGGKTAQAVTGGMAQAATIVDLGALDAKTHQPVTSRNWSGVTHVATFAEADRLLTPY